MVRSALVGGVVAARRIAAARRTRPLAFARLWHQPDPARTSQLRTVAEFMTEIAVGARTLLVLGGNRTGKSEVGAQLATAFALGGDHPDVVAWAEVNRIDLRSIPLGPGKVCASQLTSADSLRYGREKLAKYAPAGSTWRNRYGPGEAELRYPNGGTVLCKSNDQGARSYQGDSWRLFWADEEHDEPVIDEAQMRLLDQGGLTVYTMTPLRGRTYVYHRWVKAPSRDVRVAWLHMRDNPHLPADEVRRLLEGMSALKRAARERGEFAVLEGTVYELRRDLHVVRAFTPPPEWPRYRGWDFGVSNPTAVVWLAWDQRDDVLHVYREYQVTGRTAVENGREVLRLEAGESIQWTAADPAAADARLTLFREVGIRTLPADNAVLDGIDSVAQRLRPNVEGRPRLVFHDCCPETIESMELYHWLDRATREAPEKVDDHLPDAVRYAVRLHGRMHPRRVH